MEKVVLLLGHGSPVSEANMALWEIADMVQKRGGYNFVQPAFLQFERPALSEAVDLLVEKGVRNITIHPYFLYMGSHVTKDLPREIERIRGRHPGLELKITNHLGVHTNLAEVAVERIEEIRTQNSNVKNNISPPYLHLSPSSIEAHSMKIIEEKIDSSRFSSSEFPIVQRAVHATADFDFVDTITFHPKAIETGLKAILDGKAIITDVRMVEAGINKRRLARFGSKVLSFIENGNIVKEGSTTKAASAIKKAGGYLDGNIIAIGNAPTALKELIRLVKAEGVKPALIIGLPVGFVGARETKEALERVDIPYITNRGDKGGSPVTVAVVNALLLMAEEQILNCER